MKSIGRIVIATLATALAGIVALPVPAFAAGGTRTPIEHFVFLMQGDRSFDNYFGTYPGADGVPPGTCQPLVLGRPSSGCVAPFPLHGKVAAALDASRTIVASQIDAGRMDGFVAAYQRQGRDGTTAMGYYDERDIPFYWNVAHDYVLFDRFYSSAPYGIRFNRSYWVAGAPPPGGSERVPAGGYGDQQTIFDRLQKAGVSWKFYVQDYDPTETYQTASTADPAVQTARVPLLNYHRFVTDPSLRSHIADLDDYFRDLEQGTLPAVAYVASSGASERSARSIPTGQKLVRNMVNSLMMSRYWRSSALMWSYDGSGGWYDHAVPQRIQGHDTGLRVPALLVSPYARQGQVNHSLLDYTSALRFIEDNWGLAPLTARDASANNLSTAFDFGTARAARLLPAGPVPGAAPPVKAGLIYGLYGAAGLVSLVLLGLAWRPVRITVLSRWLSTSKASRAEVPAA